MSTLAKSTTATASPTIPCTAHKPGSVDENSDVETDRCPTYAWCRERSCVGSVCEDEHTGEFISVGQFSVYLYRAPVQEARVIVTMYDASKNNPFAHDIEERLTADEARTLGNGLLERAAQLAAGPIDEAGAR